MDVKTPSERFLMTVPKPIHDWLSEEADNLGVTVQDRIRVMLEEESKRRLNLTFTDAEVEAIRDECYRVGKDIYDEFATARKRLTILQTPRDVFSKEFRDFLLEHDAPNDLMIPVIHKDFQPLLNSCLFTQIDEWDVCSAAKAIAETENNLLSICEPGDKLFEEVPFRCDVRFNDGKWHGHFIVALNSERTPTIADTFRATS